MKLINHYSSVEDFVEKNGLMEDFLRIYKNKPKNYPNSIEIIENLLIRCSIFKNKSFHVLKTENGYTLTPQNLRRS